MSKTSATLIGIGGARRSDVQVEQRIVRGARLLLEDVEARLRKMTAGQRLEEGPLTVEEVRETIGRKSG